MNILSHGCGFENFVTHSDTVCIFVNVFFYLYIRPSLVLVKICVLIMSKPNFFLKLINNEIKKREQKNP